MSLKEFWKNSFVAFMLKNVLIAIVALLVLAWLTLLAVDFYTLHGRSETVPDVRGMYVEEAQSVMEQYNLHIKVVDSLYVGDRPLGAVIEQIPAAGSKVKPDRDIYLVINSKVVKQIPLPDIFETSQRQAEVTLRSVGM
ncbi:MAG: PASTA domain-containing protein, partial [Prevotellaceae bacterium]|nr:PASTA domain-containing protein [Prevotellaceae bacterium]